MEPNKELAVCVRKAYKKYGSKKHPNIVIDCLNMTVPKGVIYGLLGASGCGKTTLLSCIVGRKDLDSGKIWVLGGEPGTRSSKVPGPSVGYMPQELALYVEFSIRETLKYFGWVAGMTTAEVNEEIQFLEKFLALPPIKRLVKNLSGGQQRRVSLAAALLAKPELLILDEPTAGLDPLLRQNIWDHLVQITKNGETTIIITTHYIDETLQAHQIGIMRAGHFLAEESPSALLKQYNCDSLEDVFLHLSLMQNLGKPRRSIITPGSAIPEARPAAQTEESAVETGEIGVYGDVRTDHIRMHTEIVEQEMPDEEKPPRKWSAFHICKRNHLKALVWKDFLWMLRNYVVIGFIICLPVIQIILFCLCVGHDPKEITIAVVNEELAGPEEPCTYWKHAHCNITRLSCRYLDTVRNHSTPIKMFATLDDAQQMVRDGNALAAVLIFHNFSVCSDLRAVLAERANKSVVHGATIQVWMDKSNHVLSEIFTKLMIDWFYQYQSDLAEECYGNLKIGEIPLQINNPKPIYGDKNPSYTNYAAPGMILTIVFFMSVAMTSGSMLMERKEGILERAQVCGIKVIEILFSHVITQFMVMFAQTIFIIIFAFWIFGLKNEGSILWTCVLTIASGFCGMSLGFVISCLCYTDRTATHMAMACFIPTISLSGVIWPTEALSQRLQDFVYFLPLTLPTDSFRSILQKGWPIEKPVVYRGFVATIIWILVFLSLSVFIILVKRRV